MGIVQQFLSPFYNRRTDEFRDGVRFLELVHDEIRARAGDVPLMTKVPAETEAPPFVRRRLSAADAVTVCERLDTIGYDALVPVNASVFWDMSIVRGEFPSRAWRDERFRGGYAEAFGGRMRASAVALGNWVESLVYDFEPAWNADLCRTVRERVDVPVLTEGGIRQRREIDRLLGHDCDMVGMARPFYAEPELPARLLGDISAETRVVCENCNNCAVPQATGKYGVCRTPSVLQRAGTLRKEGAYDRGQQSDQNDQSDRSRAK
jgi:2,4-dienoyl-CoA reductase-like NADH-dependent reductase (Old Yellow Enzyme family)